MTTKQSAVNVWLQDAMRARLGNDQSQQIMGEAAKHGGHRYAYMIGVLDTLGHPDIGEEYRRKYDANTRERSVRKNKRYLAYYKQDLTEHITDQRRQWLQGRIQKIEKFLEDAPRAQ